LAPHWDDLLTNGTGEGIFTATTGSTPNRHFIVEWRTHYFNPPVGTANFEVVFLESGATHFTTKYGTNTQTGSQATVGVQGGPTGPSTQFECNTGGTTSGLQLNWNYTP